MSHQPPDFELGKLIFEDNDTYSDNKEKMYKSIL